MASSFDKPFKAGYFALACFGLTSLGLVAWHFHYSYLLFSELDGGVLTDAAWQQYKGGIPYRDFLTAAPPLFLLPAGWTFRLFGPTWGSLSILVCLFSFFTYAWLFLLLWRTTEAVWKAMGFSFVVQILTLAPASWWWYNAITEIVAALFFAAVCGLVAKPHDRMLRYSFVIGEALLGLGKPNIAGPLIILSIAFLLTIRGVRFFAIAATLGAIILDVGILALQGITVTSLLQNYMQASSGRLSPAMLYYILIHPGLGCLTMIMTMTIAGLAMATFLAIMFAHSVDPRTRANQLILFGIAVFVTLCGFTTNDDLKTVDITCLLVVFAFIELKLTPNAISPARLTYGIGQALIGSLILWNLVMGATRWDFYFVGGLYTPPSLRVNMQTPALFRGMQVSPHLVEILRDVNTVLNDRGLLNDPTKKIFFGPGVDFCYPAFSLPVEPFLPLWWENVPSTRVPREYPDGSYNSPGAFQNPFFPPGHARDPRVQHFIDAKFAACIFQIHPGGIPDMTFLPADLRGELYEHYSLEYHGSLAIFTPKE